MATRRSLALLSTCAAVFAFHPHPAGSVRLQPDTAATNSAQAPAPKPDQKKTAPRPPTDAAKSRAEIRDLFVEYLRLHAANEMKKWAALFVPGAIAVRTGSDGRVETYTDMNKFAAEIEEAAKSLKEQHETFDDVKISVEGDAGVYETLYSLYQNEKKVQQGRVWFSVVRVQGTWKIASFVWYKH